MEGIGTAQKRKTYRIVKTKRNVIKKKVTYFLVAIVTVALVIFLVYYVLGPKNPTVIDITPKIALVDHLSLQWPDPSFNQTTMDILNTTGLKIDYYPSKDVTVDFYRTLPKHNYRLIIFRVHSTATPENETKGLPPYVVFFTSENFSSSAHVSEWQNPNDMRLVYVVFPNSEQPYFGITPKFVSDSMEGRFNDTIIIAMGCEGLRYDSMAHAFIEKGAKAYISWNGPVSATHTDNATVSLLRHLIIENQTIEKSIDATMSVNDVGPDRANNDSTLICYPDKAGTDFFTYVFKVDLTTASPAVNMTKKSTSKRKEYSGTTFVP